MEPVAETTLFVERPPGRRRRICLRVGHPEPDRRGDYRCAVEFPGFERRRYNYGIDSIQALVLAVRFLTQRISALLDDGWRFYLGRNDKEPLDVRLAWFGDSSAYVSGPPNPRVGRTSIKRATATEPRTARRSRTRR